MAVKDVGSIKKTRSISPAIETAKKTIPKETSPKTSQVKKVNVDSKKPKTGPNNVTSISAAKSSTILKSKSGAIIKANEPGLQTGYVVANTKNDGTYKKSDSKLKGSSLAVNNEASNLETISLLTREDEDTNRKYQGRSNEVSVKI